MDDRNNTIAGWALFAGICALGLTIGTGMLGASHAPEKPGFPIEDAEAGGGGGKAHQGGVVREDFSYRGLWVALGRGPEAVDHGHR